MDSLHDNCFANFESEEEELEGQLQAWNLTFAFASTMAVKAACLLGIPDILGREGPGASLSLQEIASRLSSKAPDTDLLFRIMRFLCAKGVFSLNPAGTSTELKYGLTPTSKYLLKAKSEILMLTSEASQAPHHHFSDCVLEGGVAFEKAHGLDIWSFASKNPDFNNLLNDGMGCTSEIVMEALLKHYDGFEKLNTLVDVGGRVGKALSCIVTKHPSIKGINYDLPHVVATAPSYPGVEHVAGDMFKSVPSADAIFMKSIMHDWDDAECIKILKNCRKALPEITGKLIIVDAILEAHIEHNNPFSDAGIVHDLAVATIGGKERTREQWKALLVEAGFPQYETINVPGCVQSVIEAFPA